eukprot:scaffold66111_cov47-Phaeocystis_antarctica.AAC.1
MSRTLALEEPTHPHSAVQSRPTPPTLAAPSAMQEQRQETFQSCPLRTVGGTLPKHTASAISCAHEFVRPRSYRSEELTTNGASPRRGGLRPRISPMSSRPTPREPVHARARHYRAEHELRLHGYKIRIYGQKVGLRFKLDPRESPRVPPAPH